MAVTVVNPINKTQEAMSVLGPLMSFSTNALERKHRKDINKQVSGDMAARLSMEQQKLDSMDTYRTLLGRQAQANANRLQAETKKVEAQTPQTPEERAIHFQKLQGNERQKAVNRLTGLHNLNLDDKEFNNAIMKTLTGEGVKDMMFLGMTEIPSEIGLTTDKKDMGDVVRAMQRSITAKQAGTFGFGEEGEGIKAMESIHMRSLMGQLLPGDMERFNSIAATGKDPASDVFSYRLPMPGINAAIEDMSDEALRAWPMTKKGRNASSEDKSMWRQAMRYRGLLNEDLEPEALDSINGTRSKSNPLGL